MFVPTIVQAVGNPQLLQFVLQFPPNRCKIPVGKFDRIHVMQSQPFPGQNGRPGPAMDYHIQMRTLGTPPVHRCGIGIAIAIAVLVLVLVRRRRHWSSTRTRISFHEIGSVDPAHTVAHTVAVAQVHAVAHAHAPAHRC